VLGAQPLRLHLRDAAGLSRPSGFFARTWRDGRSASCAPFLALPEPASEIPDDPHVDERPGSRSVPVAHRPSCTRSR
jgi:hypothetical protein